MARKKLDDPTLASLLASHHSTARLEAREELILLVMAYVAQAKRVTRQFEKRKGRELEALIHATVHNVLVDLLKRMVQDPPPKPLARKGAPSR